MAISGPGEKVTPKGVNWLCRFLLPWVRPKPNWADWLRVKFRLDMLLARGIFPRSVILIMFLSKAGLSFLKQPCSAEASDSQSVGHKPSGGSNDPFTGVA